MHNKKKNDQIIERPLQEWECDKYHGNLQWWENSICNMSNWVTLAWPIFKHNNCPKTDAGWVQMKLIQQVKSGGQSPLH